MKCIVKNDIHCRWCLQRRVQLGCITQGLLEEFTNQKTRSFGNPLLPSIVVYLFSLYISFFLSLWGRPVLRTEHTSIPLFLIPLQYSLFFNFTSQPSSKLELLLARDFQLCWCIFVENPTSLYKALSHGPFKVGRTQVRPTLHLSHAPTNWVETDFDNRVRPTSKVGFNPVVKRVRDNAGNKMAERGCTWSNRKIALLLQVWSKWSIQAQLIGAVRKEVPYRKIAEELWKAEFEHTYKQCRDKVKVLKTCEASITYAKTSATTSGGPIRKYVPLSSESWWTWLWLTNIHAYGQVITYNVYYHFYCIVLYSILLSLVDDYMQYPKNMLLHSVKVIPEYTSDHLCCSWDSYSSIGYICWCFILAWPVIVKVIAMYFAQIV